MRTDITKINEKTPHQDLTEGLMVFAGGTSNGCIPVVDGKRLAFDMDHCKGCGICANVCPFGAIEMKEGNV